MSTKCLVTKLKGSVDNNTLLKLGEFTIYVDSNINFKGPKGIEIRTIDGTITYKGENSKQVTIIDSSSVVLQAGSLYFAKVPYSLSYMQITASDAGSIVDYDAVLNSRKYSNSLVLQELNNQYGTYDITKCADSLSSIKTELTLSYLYDLSGNISAFSVLSANYLNINGTLIRGDIANMLNGYSTRGVTTVQVIPNGVITFGQTVLKKGKVHTFTYSGGEWSYTVA